jgi:hypothetical protein
MDFAKLERLIMLRRPFFHFCNNGRRPINRPSPPSRSMQGWLVVTDAFLLPQVVLNAISGSSANAISPWFYVGGTVICVALHMNDMARARRYVANVRPSYLYASTRDGLFGSVAWHAVVTCEAALLAVLLQQRLGGDFLHRWRSRSGGYEIDKRL